MIRPLIITLLLGALAACTTLKPEDSAFEAAEQRIAAAEKAGAEELAPVELRFARSKLESARRGMDKGQYDVALWLIEESEINSGLAIEKSRAAMVRRQANEQRRENEILREELRANYGEDFE
jgi:hypothetical protein